MWQGTQTQELILYFDEINALSEGTGISSNDGIQVKEGTGIFIGRRVLSSQSYAVQVNGANPNGYFKCNELISEYSYALGLNDFTTKIVFDINYIQGNSSGVVFAYKLANFELKNAKVKNVNSSLPSRVISLNRDDNVEPSMTLNNVKLITGNNLTTEIIHSAEYQFPNDPVVADIDNYGLLVNDAINTTYINLFIGDVSNYLYIDSSDLT